MSTAPSTVPARQTIADLAREPGQAELVGGRIIPLIPTGFRPNVVAGRILADHADATGRGVALMGNMGYVVPELPSGRESFSPDVSYDSGPFSDDDMKFVRGAPTFAVEVRGEGDYDPAAERSIVAKRADYFAAGTLVVWDIDPKTDRIQSFRADTPENPETFARGEVAQALPAVGGWAIEVDRVFP